MPIQWICAGLVMTLKVSAAGLGELSRLPFARCCDSHEIESHSFMCPEIHLVAMRCREGWQGRLSAMTAAIGLVGLNDCNQPVPAVVDLAPDDSFWLKAAEDKAELYQNSEDIYDSQRSTYLVITRRVIAFRKSSARLVAIAFDEFRQHRQKRHTKRAGEAGVSSRARGQGEGARSSRQ